MPLGEVPMVAPDRQRSGAGRSMPPDVTGRFVKEVEEIDGQRVTAYAIDATPALAAVHGVVELAPRKPNIAVSGVNFGENLGFQVTVSGTSASTAGPPRVLPFVLFQMRPR